MGKICIVCNQDCSPELLYKDPQGPYICDKCYFLCVSPKHNSQKLRILTENSRDQEQSSLLVGGCTRRQMDLAALMSQCMAVDRMRLVNESWCPDEVVKQELMVLGWPLEPILERPRS